MSRLTYTPFVGLIRTLYSKYKYDARKRNRKFDLTLYCFCNIILSNCFYCGSEPKQRISQQKCRGKLVLYYSGLDRIDNTIGYVLGNVVPSCYCCNKMKGVMSAKRFKTHISKIANHK